MRWQTTIAGMIAKMQSVVWYMVIRGSQ